MNAWRIDCLVGLAIGRPIEMLAFASPRQKLSGRKGAIVNQVQQHFDSVMLQGHGLVYTGLGFEQSILNAKPGKQSVVMDIRRVMAGQKSDGAQYKFPYWGTVVTPSSISAAPHCRN